MNDLRGWILVIIENERIAMNFLQNHGVISDNCIDLADIAAADTARTLAFLKTNWHRRTEL